MFVSTQLDSTSDCLVLMDNITKPNDTHKLCLNNVTTVHDQLMTSDNWIKIVDYIQFACTSMGCIANIITLITLAINHKGFSRIILILLRHQSLVDSWVCLLASLVVIQPFMWTTGIYYVDVIICHAWHSQAFYWGAVTLSTYNLVGIAVERCLAICKPLTYQCVLEISNKKLAVYFAVLYFGTIILTHGTYLQTRFINNECKNEYFMEGPIVEKYFFAFVIFTYITTYLLPALIMAILYGIIAFQLNKRNKNKILGKSTVIEKASSQLTKTAVVVTLIFIVTIGYDLHYYLVGYTGVAQYKLNTPVQKAGVFLSNMNSFINPFIYAILMPLYRKSIQKTFCVKQRCAGDAKVTSFNCCKKSKRVKITHSESSGKSIDTLVHADSFLTRF